MSWICYCIKGWLKLSKVVVGQGRVSSATLPKWRNCMYVKHSGITVMDTKPCINKIVEIKYQKADIRDFECFAHLAWKIFHLFL